MAAKQRLLVLGGTQFIGRKLVEQLVDDERFELTLVNRGQTNPHLFPGVKKIYGDRNSAEFQLPKGASWDYVIDLSCYYPDSLSRVLDMLNQSVKRYIFVSTCSVYDNEADQSVMRNETAPVLKCEEQDRQDDSPHSYGKRKAECERLLQQSGFGYTILRPALVFGPYDSTDRLYYWLHQVACENDLLMPNGGMQKFSVTYVSDLVSAMIAALNSEQVSSVFNVTTVPELTIGQLVRTTSEILGREPNLLNADSEFLHRHNVSPWTDLPLWLDCNYFTYDNSRIKEALGFQPTDFKSAIRDTITYFKTLKWPDPNYGMPQHRWNSLIEMRKEQINTGP